MDLKTYKTWEVIKMLSENPVLKFKNEDKEIGLIRTIKCSESGYIEMNNKGCNNGINGNINFDDKWTLVQNPVDFMTAVKSGKRIRVDHQLIKCLKISEDYYILRDILNVLGGVLNDENIREVLTEGKFYIEE